MDKNKEVNQDDVIDDKKTFEDVTVENPTISLTPQVEGVSNSVRHLWSYLLIKILLKFLITTIHNCLKWQLF